MKAERVDKEDELLIDVFFTNLVKGQDGATPVVGSNLNWWIKGEDTGVRAKADIPVIGGNGNWWIGGTDTGKPSLQEIPDTVKIPRGAIVMWSGSPTNIPSGWALCNGRNSTPDLQGKFIVGYESDSTDYNRIGKSAGNATVKLTLAHIPEHYHLNGMRDDRVETFQQGSTEPTNSGCPLATDAWEHNCLREGFTSKVGSEEEDITPIDVRPPYYVLAYIMKL